MFSDLSWQVTSVTPQIPSHVFATNLFAGSMGKMQAGQPGYTELASPDLEIASARAPMTPHTARRRDHMYHLVFDALSVLGLLIVFAVSQYSVGLLQTVAC